MRSDLAPLTHFGPTRHRARAGLIVVAFAATALLGACGASGGDKPEAASTGSTTTAVSGSTTADGSTVPGDTSGSNDGSNSGSDDGSNSGSNDGSNSGSNGGPTSSGPTPTITSFTTPENIDCHNGNSQTFSVSWTTTNATKTAISIDGPGLYKTYGPSASGESLPFNCSSPHSFLLTAYGSGGKTATRSITLQPRNVQQPPTDDTDDNGSTGGTTTTGGGSPMATTTTM